MSREVFEIIQTMDLKAIETQLALQCAPVIAGLKPSNLLIIQQENVAKVQRILKCTALSYFVMILSGNKTIIFVYHRYRLEQTLNQAANRAFLIEEGYSDFTLGKVLLKFRSRYQEYMNSGTDFPHEMGVLLGYPIEDVCGFIDNKGQNYLYTGYWKVYADVPAKKHLFGQYELAKEAMIQLVSNGVGMSDIIEIYSDETAVQTAV